MRTKTWTLVAAVICLSAAVWTAVSLRNTDSTLSLVIGALKDYARDQMCWSAASNGFCVLRKMAQYEKKGRYDDAISSGVAWTEKHPQGVDADWIHRDLSFLYLKKASLDQKAKESYVEQALLYRDKLLSSASDSPNALGPLECISEYAGDISTVQKCVQYRNSIKLLDRMNALLSQNKDRLSRQFRPDPAEHEEVQLLSAWVSAAIQRVKSKQLRAGCQ